jgi:hypothetical protein
MRAALEARAMADKSNVPVAAVGGAHLRRHEGGRAVPRAVQHLVSAALRCNHGNNALMLHSKKIH